GDAGARGVFEEEIDDRLAAQRRELLDLALLRVRHVFGDVEQTDRVVPRECASVEEVPHDSIVTSSVPSISRSLTRTRSSRALGRFLPTKSGRMGSSR